jgi:nucleoside phosphorylase
VLALVSAMSEEISSVIETLSDVRTQEFGGRQFHSGRFHGVDVVAVFSRYGARDSRRRCRVEGRLQLA